MGDRMLFYRVMIIFWSTIFAVAVGYGTYIGHVSPFVMLYVLGILYNIHKYKELRKLVDAAENNGRG